MSNDFNERSPDAMFSKILQRMDTQAETLGRIEQSMGRTNERVDTLERERWYQRGVVAVVSVGVVAGWEWITKSK